MKHNLFLVELPVRLIVLADDENDAHTFADDLLKKSKVETLSPIIQRITTANDIPASWHNRQPMGAVVDEKWTWWDIVAHSNVQTMSDAWWCVTDFNEDRVFWRVGKVGSKLAKDFDRSVGSEEKARSLWEQFNSVQTGACPL